ncbi:MAG: hydantoinase B/oxoprolinase family protein, partial [Myxococcales bacterium]|nr:hydantoinase B/oxoprolinase family protein [Myxococcales bacterium]
MIIDAVQLEVFQNLLSSVAEEMGLRLQHSAFSPNIKERRDYSCAIFDDRGEMIALALHIPVHLGSTPLAVREMIRELGTHGEGDTAIANDPYLGGSHLPDVTALTPVCVDGKARFYVANRAHHADVGGLNSGSMGLATEIYHEGLRIPPVRLVVGGELNSDVHRLLMANMRGSAEREGDFAAQLAANHAGVLRMLSIIEKYGYRPVGAAAQELTLYAERCVREAIRRIPNGAYAFTDQLDDDGTSEQPITIAVKIDVRGDELEIDFAGTSPQVPGPLNANEAITLSAVFYVLKSLVGFRIPDNAGSLRPVHLKIPEGSLLNPRMPAAVAGGNVETSQRIVDVLLGAFGQAIRVPAASVGTMTNLSIGGQDPRTGEAFAYYETIGGGMGASAESRGVDAVQCHMTNTRNTPIEVLENAYPLRVTEYSVRRGSGGRGDHEGGDGTVREIEILSDVSASILADRHRQGPYGLGGAEPGRPGKTILTRAGGKPETVPSKANLKLGPGDRLRLETPGGGGWSAKGAPKAVIQISPGDIPAIEAREVRRERAKPVVEAEAPAPEEIETPEARPAPEAAERAKRPDRAQAGPADESATEERSRRGRRRRKRRPDDEADNGV